MSIGTNIRRRRFELNMSQQELADLMGYKTRSTIAKIESEKNDVTHAKLVKFARALETTADALLAGIDNAFSGKDVAQARESNNVVAVLLAGGRSCRNNQNIPNQFIEINNKPVFIYASEAYQKSPLVDEIYIVCLEGWEGIVNVYAKQFGISKLSDIVVGGSSGVLSAKYAFDKIKERYGDDAIVIFQESTRPLVTTEMVARVINGCQNFDNAILCAPMDDCVQFVFDEEQQKYVDRYHIVTAQSPSAHRISELKEAFASVGTDYKFDETCVPMFLYDVGIYLNFIEGTANNMKIVRQEDVALFTALLRYRGIGG